MKPERGILDPSFRYTDSNHTDLKALFRRLRAEQQTLDPESERLLRANLWDLYDEPQADAQKPVIPLRRSGKA